MYPPFAIPVFVQILVIPVSLTLINPFWHTRSKKRQDRSRYELDEIRCLHLQLWKPTSSPHARMVWSLQPPLYYYSLHPFFHIKGKLHVVNGSRKLGIWRGLILSTSTQGRTLCQ
ncbi:unnamed protein product [Linum tenue]|uniref:Secreted protein n=1 Tax=Linum tenue TaxID=586396 RepID=A0AAV0Q7X0_9ROSI|nr:unnamed protein product [Linum tenue]